MIRVPLKAAQRDLLALVRAVEVRGERVVLTRRGRPVAALLPSDAIPALDLLGRVLPPVADAAGGLQTHDPQAPGIGPAPNPRSEGALRSRLSAPAAPPPPETR